MLTGKIELIIQVQGKNGEVKNQSQMFTGMLSFPGNRRNPRFAFKGEKRQGI